MHETTYSDITIYLLSIALSVHSLFDGLGLGLQNSVDSVVNIGVAVSIHKIPAAMALGVSLIKAERKKSLIMISIFCIATPLGIAIGIGLTSFGAEILIGIIVTLSSGTFIYIATTEVIVEEFSKPDHKYYKFIAFFVGVGIFTTLKSVLGGD